MQQQKMLRSNNDVWVSHGSSPAVVVRAALQRSWRKLHIKLIKFTFAFAAAAATSQNAFLNKKETYGCKSDARSGVLQFFFYAAFYKI